MPTGSADRPLDDMAEGEQALLPLQRPDQLEAAGEAAAHLAKCPSCQVEQELLGEFQVGEVRADEADVVRAGRARLRSRARAIHGQHVWRKTAAYTATCIQYPRPR